VKKSPPEILDSPLPHDHASETALLGSIVLKPELMAEASAKVRTSDFHDPVRQILWQVFYSQYVAGKPVDRAITLSMLREREGELNENAVGLLAELLRETPAAANWEYYAERVLQAAHRRRLRHAGERLLLASANGQAPADAADDAIRSLSEVKAGIAATGKVITYRRLTCAELDAAEFTTEYLIEWTLVAGQPCIAAGPKKACKTTILIALAIALATGGHFLGRFKVLRCCRVLLMTGESGLATVQETARRIAGAAGLSLSDISGLVISDQLPVLGNADYMRALRKMITDDEIEILILDPAYLCLPTDGNEASLFAMGAMLREISELCHELGVTLILIHHTKKGIADPFQPPELENIAWAGFQEWARQWILLGRREKYEPGTGLHQLWFSSGGSAGHSSLWALDINEGAFDGSTPRTWDVSVMKADEARQQAQVAIEDRRADAKNQKQQAGVDAAKRRLVYAAQKFKEGETAKALKDAAGVSGTMARLALAELINAGDLVPVEIVKPNRKTPYEGYRLKDDTTQR
jgi:hypothetical protein